MEGAVIRFFKALAGQDRPTQSTSLKVRNGSPTNVDRLTTTAIIITTEGVINLFRVDNEIHISMFVGLLGTSPSTNLLVVVCRGHHHHHHLLGRQGTDSILMKHTQRFDMILIR